jgi:hypothetical protein
MFPSEMRFRTGRAALIAGYKGAEGLRTQLKAGGLLRGTGMPQRENDGDRDARRWTWAEFTFTDVCAFRLAKVLMDAGLDGDTAREIASTEDVWQHQLFAQMVEENRPNLHGEGPAERFVLVAMGEAQRGPRWGCVEREELVRTLAGRGAIYSTAYLIVDLGALRREVLNRLADA